MNENILATLAYYDVLDFPLKAEEIFKYLIRIEASDTNLQNETLTSLKKNLDQLVLDREIDYHQSYYFLPDREFIVPLRLKKEKISEKKWKKATAAIRKLMFLPNIEAIFASGSLSFGNCDELSDLDILIVVRHGKIWLTRLLMLFVLSFFRARRKHFEKISPDKICPNHYLTTSALQVPFPGLYNAQTYINLRPIFLEDKKIISKFYKANSWISDYLIHTPAGLVDIAVVKRGILTRAVSHFLEMLIASPMGLVLENWARFFQIRRIQRGRTSNSGHLTYSDFHIALHPESPANNILRLFRNNLLKFGFKKPGLYFDSTAGATSNRVDNNF